MLHPNDFHERAKRNSNQFQNLGTEYAYSLTNYGR